MECNYTHLLNYFISILSLLILPLHYIYVVTLVTSYFVAASEPK